MLNVCYISEYDWDAWSYQAPLTIANSYGSSAKYKSIYDNKPCRHAQLITVMVCEIIKKISLLHVDTGTGSLEK